jgi:hypothetical protein
MIKFPNEKVLMITQSHRANLTKRKTRYNSIDLMTF